MPKYKHLLKTRIGTCRSGVLVEVFHELVKEDLVEFLNRFCDCELVDIFCMTEAMYSRYREDLVEHSAYHSLVLINDQLKDLKNTTTLSKEFQELNL